MATDSDMPPALLGAYRKGFAAGLHGHPCTPPYNDVRKHDGRLTWSRAFANAWRDGWIRGNAQRQNGQQHLRKDIEGQEDDLVDDPSTRKAILDDWYATHPTKETP